MSSTALRAVRELRGDSAGGDGRPFTPRGERPGTATATAAGLRAASPDSVSPAAFEALKKELDDTRLALEKEKRNTRSLEQWISELTESKESEIREAVSEARLHQAALAKAEQHASSLEELYKGQVSKLTAVVERLQSKSQPAGADPSESFSAVLREEMRVMQSAFTLKINKAAADHAAKLAELNKQTRALQEALTEERRNSAALADKLSRTAAAASASASSSATTPCTAVPTRSAGQPGATTAASALGGANAATAKPLVKSAVASKIK